MLFDTFIINSKLELKNRIVLAPLYLGWDGRSVEFRAFYSRRAHGGVGLVIAPQSTPGGIDDWEDDGFGVAFKPLIEECHDAGAKIALQIFSGNGVVDDVPVEELDSIPERFARAAAGAQEAGFDAIDIHGAHHSLFMRLLSPLQNHRTDNYGGPVENRSKVQLETVRLVRSALGSGFPILYRLSAADFAEGGVDLSVTVPFARELEKAGVDCIDVSAGTPDSPEDHASHPGTHAPLGCFKDLAAAMKKEAAVPVIAVGKLSTREIAEAVLEKNLADLVALGRPLIADPDWPKKVKQGEDESIVPCIWDNGGCLNKTIMKGLPIRCVQNSTVGFDHEGIKR